MTSSQNNLESLDLDAWLDTIAAAHPSEIEMGLDRTREVWSRLIQTLNVSPYTKIVTVAGTNGKGSTIAMVEKGLLAFDYTVGSYTSPHIQRYNERVKLNGVEVSDEQLIDSFIAVEKARDKTPLTYFEFGTLSALVILMSAKLDVVLLEIGLGGRLDAVNIIDPDIAIITSVDLDHTDWLGDDVDQIGIEKAGILRSGAVALFGEGLPSSCYQVAKGLGLKPKTYGQEITLSQSEQMMLDTALPHNNVALAFQAISEIVEKPERDVLLGVVKDLSLPGRFERYHKDGVDIILDVAHNPHAARYLAQFAKQIKGKGRPIWAVYSSLLDKDIASVVSAVAPSVDAWFIAPLKVPRAAALEDLKQHLYKGLTKSIPGSIGELEQNVLSFDSIGQALKSAVALDGVSEQVVLVFGSFYVVQEAQTALKEW